MPTTATARSIKPVKRLSALNVQEVPACDVQPGMVTLDGVVIQTVLAYQGLTQSVTIRHRCSSYVEAPDALVQIIAVCDEDMTDAIIEAVDEEEAATRRR